MLARGDLLEWAHSPATGMERRAARSPGNWRPEFPRF